MKSSDVRARLGHPVIDTDAHVLEVAPVFMDYLKEIGGSDMPARLQSSRGMSGVAPAWWTVPTRNTVDRASASLPKLLYQRLDDLGIDFSVLYPTLGNEMPQIEDAELRRVACRAFNTYQADMFAGFGDRLTPAAVIPMFTPQEAIEELEHAVKTLGAKVAAFYRVIRREPGRHRDNPDVTLPANRFDTFGLDSDYDYDPVWAKFVELGVPATSHSTSQGFGTRQSPTNFAFNKLGHFAAASEALCKSLFMGGVTRRFPTLNFAFLEGGVGWACDLYAETVSVWRKRNPEAMARDLDPALLDKEVLLGLFAEHGHERVRAKMDDIREFFNQAEPVYRLARSPSPSDLDDWALARIEREEDLRELFTSRFYFGSEGDSPLIPWAFNDRINPIGGRLRAVFGSDIGHWDVADMDQVLEESFEPVQNGLLSADDFKEFVFLNPARLYTGMNPDFFKGTRVEAEVARIAEPPG